MPDISLLQSDIEVEARESRIPGIFLTVSIIFLIISVGSYAGLYFYEKAQIETLNNITGSIKNLNTQNAENEVGKLNKIEDNLSALKQLRQSHTDTNEVISAIAESVSENVFYSSGDIDVFGRNANLKGTALSSKSLAAQVGIYAKSEKIESYKISSVVLDPTGSVNFNAVLNIKR